MSAFGPFHREIDVLDSHGTGVLVPGGDGSLPTVIESILIQFPGEVGGLALCNRENNRGKLGIGHRRSVVAMTGGTTRGGGGGNRVHDRGDDNPDEQKRDQNLDESEGADCRLPIANCRLGGGCSHRVTSRKVSVGVGHEISTERPELSVSWMVAGSVRPVGWN